MVSKHKAKQTPSGPSIPKKNWGLEMGNRTLPLILVLVAVLMASLFMTQMKPWISYENLTYADSCRIVVKNLHIDNRACYINDSLVIAKTDLKFVKPPDKYLFKRIEKGDTLTKQGFSDTIKLSKKGVIEEFPLVLEKPKEPRKSAQ